MRESPHSSKQKSSSHTSVAQPEQPDVWSPDSPGSDSPAGVKLGRLHDKVRPGGGSVVDASTIWCTVCKSIVRLPQPHQAQKWISHARRQNHIGAYALAYACPEQWFGSHKWLDQRKREWRELVREKKLNRFYGSIS